ncbi:tetratricopeptide repeat protein [Bradyrhizobium sp. USDA 4473]
MRILMAAVLELALATICQLSVARAATDCEAVYHAVADAKTFPTPKSKAQYLRDNAQDCKGTGIYESRLAYFYVQSGELDEAVRVLKEGLSTPNSFHRELKYSLADIDVTRGELGRAFENGMKLKDEYSDWYGGYMLLAKVTLMQGQFAESVRYGSQANKLSPNSSTYLGLAIAYHQLQEDKEAVEAGLKAIELDPTVLRSGVGMNETIYSLVRLTRYKDAAELIKNRMMNDAAWQKDPTFIKAYEYVRGKVPGEFVAMRNR